MAGGGIGVLSDNWIVDLNSGGGGKHDKMVLGVADADAINADLREIEIGHNQEGIGGRGDIGTILGPLIGDRARGSRSNRQGERRTGRSCLALRLSNDFRWLLRGGCVGPGKDDMTRSAVEAINLKIVRRTRDGVKGDSA